MIVKILRLLVVILLCITLVTYVVKGERYNAKFTLSYFMGQLANEDIPDLYTPVKEWFASVRTGNDFIDTIAGIAQVLVFGAVLPLQSVIFLGYFFKIWLA